MKTKSSNTVNRKKASDINIKILKYIPIILMIVAIPLILRWHVAPLREGIARFWVSDIETDLYSYTKTVWIIIVSMLMAVMMFFTLSKDRISRFTTYKPLYISLAVFSLISVISTLTSGNKDIAMWGAPDRHEGLMVHLCYIIIFIYTYISIENDEDFKFIKISFTVLSAIMIFIGLTQIANKDIFSNEFVQNLLIPAKYRGNLEPESTNGMVYLTLMHSNYVGSYTSLIIPFFAVLALSNHESKAMRVLSALIAAVTVLILVKSNSQAGIVGTGIGVLALLIIYFRKIFKSKKLLIGALIFAVAAAGIANIVSKGLLLDNTLDIFADAKRLIVKDGNYVYDPTYGLPVYDIEAEGNKVRIETVDGQLNVNYADGLKLEFTDSAGNPIAAEYNEEQMNYRFPAPFDKLMLLESSESTTDFSQIAVYYNDFTYFILEYKTGEGAYLIDSQGYRYELEVAPHIGFEGSEKVGSMRGYIWSRTLPMILEKPLFGYGPDNFLMAFPHYDIVAKTYAYDTPFMIVDKPHNIYLLYAVNSGIIALGAMLVLWGMYIVKSFRIYALRKEYTKGDYYGAACAVAITGYLAAGFFNDSVPTVAPLFWVLLGAGYAMNYINRNEAGKTEKSPSVSSGKIK